MPNRRIVCLILALLLVSVGFSYAQDQQVSRVQVVTITVKSGMVPQFEDYIKKVVEAANKTEASQYWGFYQVGLGGPGNTYMVALPFSKWAELDGWSAVPSLVTEAYGEKEGATILRSGSVAIESVETAAYARAADLSTAPEDSPPKAFTLVTEMQVKLSKVREFTLLMSKVKTAREQLDAPESTVWTSVMGETANYVTTVGFDKHAERDGWLVGGAVVRKAYGDAEGEQLIGIFLNSVQSYRNYVLISRSDLSRPRMAMTSN